MVYLFRKPSTGEIVGTTQAKRRISRKYHLRAVTDPTYPLKNTRRRALRRIGYYSLPMRLLRFALRMGRGR